MTRVGDSARFSHGRNLSVPDGYKPPRDRQVKSQHIPCPDCEAGVGERCLNPSGGLRSRPHSARRRMALRAEREQVNQ